MRLVIALVLVGCVAKPPRPGAWTKIAGATQPGPLRSPRLAWDPDLGAVVLYGGNGPVTATDAMWRYDGASWIQMCDPCGVDRATGGFAWDGTRLVSFGGEDHNDDRTNDVFTYDGTWTAQSTSGGGPPVQIFAQLVPYHDQLWVVGGYGPSGPQETVFSLANGQWTEQEVLPSDDVTVAVGMAATADVDHDRILALVDTTGNSDHDEVISFDGTTWTQLCEHCTGTVRTGGSLVHIPGHDLTLLFGGETAAHDQALPGTWVLDGQRFIPYDDPTALPARADNGVAYDPDRDRLVVYGGLSETCDYCDETWELSF